MDNIEKKNKHLILRKDKTKLVFFFISFYFSQNCECERMCTVYHTYKKSSFSIKE